jgi:hypothetical protein
MTSSGSFIVMTKGSMRASARPTDARQESYQAADPDAEAHEHEKPRVGEHQLQTFEQLRAFGVPNSRKTKLRLLLA